MPGERAMVLGCVGSRVVAKECHKCSLDVMSRKSRLFDGEEMGKAVCGKRVRPFHT
jgi:hypothetical protein